MSHPLPRGFIIILLEFFLFHHSFSIHSAFQGTCADADSVCDQLCIKVSQDTYSCDCYDGHSLKEDGAACEVINAPPTDPTDGKKMEKKEEDDWMIKIKTSTTSETKTRNSEERVNSLSFSGHNFARFPSMDSLYLETNITLEFRYSFPHSGLLFFGGLFKEDDFISIALKDGSIVLRLDCGEGISQDIFYGPFNPDKWHTILVHRKFCNEASISVDGKLPIIGTHDQNTFYKGISTDDGVYLGGLPSNAEFVEARTSVDGGFRGCIRLLVVNGIRLLDTEKNINKMENKDMIRQCTLDGEKTDIEKEGKEDTVVDEKETSIPRLVNHPGGPLHHHPPSPSSPSSPSSHSPSTSKPTTSAPTTTTRSIPSPQSIYPVKPLSESTASTTKSSIEKSVEFDGGRFLEQSAPVDVEDYAALSMTFKPKSGKGLLFLWKDRTHHLAVFLQDGHILTELSLGEEETIILKSEKTVALYSWHTMELWRSGKGMLLKVDRDRWMESELTSQDSKTIRPGRIFIGGTNIHLSSSLENVGDYKGCIQQIILNSHVLSLSEKPSATASANLAGNTEVPSSLPFCSSDHCSSLHCPHDCMATEDHEDAICMCSYPTYGDKCEKTLTDKGPFRMEGHSYLEITNTTVMNHITGDDLHLSLEIKLDNSTIDVNQILVHASDEDDDDFLLIEITKERQVRVSIDLGSGPLQLTHPEIIPANKWTTIECIRNKRRVRFSVDGHSPLVTMANEGSEQLNVYSSLHIGGRPSIASLRSDGFHGCIQWIRIADISIHSPYQVQKAVNVLPC